jgi:hypothetical protein
MASCLRTRCAVIKRNAYNKQPGEYQIPNNEQKTRGCGQTRPIQIQRQKTQPFIPGKILTPSALKMK